MPAAAVCIFLGMHDNWTAGDTYENYMGRWSRPLALAFVKWLNPAPGAHWLDFGCGTGALAAAICTLAAPKRILACDPSDSFISHARALLRDERVSFRVGSLEDLSEPAGALDWIVSGLVLNFLPNPAGAIAAMHRLVRPGGTVGAYVWDYAEGMQLLRHFWDAAIEISPAASSFDEGTRFPMCNPTGLRALFADSGFLDVTVSPVEITVDFRDFDCQRRMKMAHLWRMKMAHSAS